MKKKEPRRGMGKRIYFPKSDFYTMDEYIDTMRRPSITKLEADKADWDGFLVSLSKMEGNQERKR